MIEKGHRAGRVGRRVIRLRRSLWQWVAMAVVLLALKLQRQVPPAVEIVVAAQFLIFVGCPLKA
jgi:hypothetical protein